MVLAGLRVAGKGCGWRSVGSTAKIRGLGDQEGVSCQARGFSLPPDVVRFWEYCDGRASRGVLCRSPLGALRSRTVSSGLKQDHSASSSRFSNSLAYYGLAMDLQKFGLSVYLVQVLFGVIDIPAMLVATTTMIYVGRRATVASFLILAGLMVISNMFVPEGELPASAFGVEGLRSNRHCAGTRLRDILLDLERK